MRILATLCGGFAAAIFAAQYLISEAVLLKGAWLCLLLGLIGLLFPENWRKRAVLFSVGLALGLGWNWLYLQTTVLPMEASADLEASGVSMTVCDYPLPTNRGAKVTVKLDCFPRGKAVYYGDKSLLELVPGQSVTDDVRTHSASAIRDDDITIFTSKGIFLRLTSLGEPQITTGSKDALRWIPLRLGHRMQQQIEMLADGDAAGFLAAILTGEKQGLSEASSVALSEAGLYHILAVSGMHCGFLMTLVTLVVGRRRILAVVGVPLLIFYALLVGGSPSVVRACVMLSFLLAAPLFGREGDPPTSLMAALALILLHNPCAAASISLQLSFSAVAGLLWLTPKLHRMLVREKNLGRGLQFVAASFSATMGALVFTIPLSAYYFGTLVLVSPLSNLLCLWAASLVFLLGLPAVLLSFFLPGAAALIGLVPRVLTWYILHTAHLLSSIPYHALYFVNPYLKFWLIYAYVLFAAAYLMKPKKRRVYASAALLAMLALAVTVSLGERRYEGRLNFAVLDVGQGECVLMNDGEQFALMDCGSGNSWYDPGKVAADQLMTMGCHQLDYLILSHYDSDHVNGVETLMARLPVKQLLLPESPDDAGLQERVLHTARKYDTEVRCIRKKTDLKMGKSQLQIYPPLGTGGDNEAGLAALCSRHGYDILVTGDMGGATEHKLLKAYPLPEIDTLVVGHHGSKFSSSWEFLEALRPETAIVSVGDNAFGHPAEEALFRMRMTGAQVLRTDLHGNIFIYVN